MIFNIESFLYGLTKKRKGQSVHVQIFQLIFEENKKHFEQILRSVPGRILCSEFIAETCYLPANPNCKENKQALPSIYLF
jgi:hypothetical protein